MTKKNTISVISASCGVKPHTLRIWEKRYHLFQPARSERGQRLYSDEDMLKASLVATLIDSGFVISTLADLSLSELQELKNKITDNAHQNKRSLHHKQLETILGYMSEYRIDAVANELQHARISTGAREYILDLVLPVIREIGIYVSKGKYSITQEHIISTIIRDQLSQIYLPNLGDDDFNIALATPEGNLHEFSILIADILCRANRFNTRYLGATHPALCLAEALNVLKSKTLILGVVSSDQWDYTKNIIPYLKQMDKTLQSEITIILGGGYKMDFPKFKKIKEIMILKSFEDFDKYLESLK